MTTIRRTLTVFLAILVSTQCATVTAQSGRTGVAPDNARAMLAAAERITPGSRVTLELMDGRRFKAVMLPAEHGIVVVQKRTRLPEPPLRVDPGQIAYLELDGGREGIGKMLAIGAAIGTGVTLAFLAILAAAMSD